MDLDAFTDMCLPYLIADGRVAENPDEKTIEWAKKIVSLYQPQMSYAAEIVDLSTLFFNEHPVLNEAAKKYLLVNSSYCSPRIQSTARTNGSSRCSNCQSCHQSCSKETGVKGKNLFMPIRVAVSGQMHGPELPETIELFGREKSLAHLNQVLN